MTRRRLHPLQNALLAECLVDSAVTAVWAASVAGALGVDDAEQITEALKKAAAKRRPARLPERERTKLTSIH
jgi:hypothetical protein